MTNNPPPLPPKATTPLDYALPAKRRSRPLLVAAATLGVCLLACMILGAIVRFSQTGSLATPKAPASSTPTGFSDWDGSHVELVKLVKKNLHDPESFEHVHTQFWDMKTHFVVLMNYRTKNALGALQLESVKAKCGKDGSVIEIMQ